MDQQWCEGVGVGLEPLARAERRGAKDGGGREDSCMHAESMRSLFEGVLRGLSSNLETPG